MSNQAVFYKKLIRPLLFIGDPEKTHEHTLTLLSRMTPLEAVMERLISVRDTRLRVAVGSLAIANPVGLAGGFDKKAAAASRIALPVSLTLWDWVVGPIVAIVALAVWGWWLSADRKTRTLWSAIRGP